MVGGVVADKQIIVDLFSFALDHPAPATIILITGDKDLSCGCFFPVSSCDITTPQLSDIAKLTKCYTSAPTDALSTLRNRRYRIVLVSPENATASLRAEADVVVDWREGVLGVEKSIEKYVKGKGKKKFVPSFLPDASES